MVRFTTAAQRIQEPSGRKVVNQYRLLEEVGKGTFSKVKWAEDTDGRPFAVKVIHRGVMERRMVARFEQDETTTVPFAERVKEELKILASLDHRYVMALEEVIDDPGHERLYAVLEGLAGGTLLTWSQECLAYSLSAEAGVVRRFWGDAVLAADTTASPEKGEVTVYSETVAKYLMGQILEAVAYLHEQGVIHKDLKPENIMLTMPLPAGDHRFSRLLNIGQWPQVLERRPAVEDEVALEAVLVRSGLAAKIGDFNSAAVREQPDCLIYDAEGTQHFTPPECFEDRSAGIKGKPRDMWAVGVVLFSMLLGRCPFWHEINIFLQLMIMQEDLVVPQGVLSAEAEDLIMSMLCKRPDERPTAATAAQHKWLRRA